MTELKTFSVHADLSVVSGIELDEERGIDGDSDFSIRGRLMSLVEKVAYLKKKMANLPKEKKDRKPSNSSSPTHVHTHTQTTHTIFTRFDLSVSAGTLQQLISDTMIHWAQESVIEDPELVRAMFVLLHRQYDGIGGQVC